MGDVPIGANAVARYGQKGCKDVKRNIVNKGTATSLLIARVSGISPNYGTSASPSNKRQQPIKMNTTATFAQDLKEMMNNWNELMRRAAERFPNDTDEQRYQRVKDAMNKSLGLQ
jgi:flagellar hook-basal body complex protein FliE